MRFTYCLLIILLSLYACSGNSTVSTDITSNNSELIEATPNLAIPDNRFENNYRILIFGNSHVSGLSVLIQTLISTNNSHAKINVVNAAGGFLDDTASKQKRETLLEDKLWTHVILQGQKYSQSGKTNYSTTSTKEWIHKAKSFYITPILFPEHPQRGNTEEGSRVHAIHAGIIAEQKSCIAPVGLTWDKVIFTEPQLPLYNKDGNHASLIGKLLSAFIFYEVITGNSADLLPIINEIEVDASTQQLLKQFASETIRSNQPCIFDE